MVLDCRLVLRNGCADTPGSHKEFWAIAMSIFYVGGLYTTMRSSRHAVTLRVRQGECNRTDASTCNNALPDDFGWDEDVHQTPPQSSTVYL